MTLPPLLTYGAALTPGVDGRLSGNLSVGGYAEVAEIATPGAAPAAGALRLYPKADHRLYIQDSTGTETPLTVGAALTLPLTVPLTFSPDNALDIGASGASRPRTAYVGTSEVVGANAAVLKTADGTATSPHGALETSGGYLMLGSVSGTHVSMNRYWNGAVWLAWDTSGTAPMPTSWIVTSGQVLMQTATAAAPNTPTTNVALTNAGGGAITLGGDTSWTRNAGNSMISSGNVGITGTLFTSAGVNGLGQPFSNIGALSAASLSLTGDVYARYLNTNDGSNGIVQSGAGSLYCRGANGYVYMDGGGGLQVTGGPLSVAGGIYANGLIIYMGGYYIQQNSNILQCVSSNVLSWGWLGLAGNAGINIGWNGANITTTHSLALGGAANSPGAYLACPQRIGTQICLYDAGGGNCFGLGINSGELSLITSGSVGIHASNNSGGMIWMVAGSGVVTMFNGAGFVTNGNQLYWPNSSYISGNAGYVQGSARYLKTEIVPQADADLLAMVADPRAPVSTYLWKDDQSRRNIGFIADDLAAVVPDYVRRDDAGTPNGYNPQELVAILWGALRALSVRVQQLEGVSP